MNWRVFSDLFTSTFKIFVLSRDLHFSCISLDFIAFDLLSYVKRSAGVTFKVSTIRLIISVEGNCFKGSISPIKLGEQETFIANSS